MTHTPHKLAIVIPTIGRYAELRRMLSSLAQQSRWPEQVIIVDEDESSCVFEREFPELNLRVVVLPGSASAKRNAGLRAVLSEMTLIGFMDDDILLEPQTIETLVGFWDRAAEDLGVTGCSLVNYPSLDAWRLKTLRLTSRLGLYDSRKGVVLRSGIHTMMPGVSEDTYVRWLSSMAAVFRRRVLEEFTFDEWFQGYSYLEDLDFSYRIGKKYKLTVVAGARIYHYPSEVGRPSAYLFGKKEVLNRLYFVSKHPELSRPLCFLALCVRAFMSVWLGVSRFEAHYFNRVAGNVAGILTAVTRRELLRFPSS
jgi:GT2 family glycosyltransferase